MIEVKSGLRAEKTAISELGLPNEQEICGLRASNVSATLTFLFCLVQNVLGNTSRRANCVLLHPDPRLHNLLPARSKLFMRGTMKPSSRNARWQFTRTPFAAWTGTHVMRERSMQKTQAKEKTRPWTVNSTLTVRVCALVRTGLWRFVCMSPPKTDDAAVHAQTHACRISSGNACAFMNHETRLLACKPSHWSGLPCGHKHPSISHRTHVRTHAYDTSHRTTSDHTPKVHFVAHGMHQS